MNKAVFLDRDGVINEERGYVHRIEDFVLLPRAAQGMHILAKAGYKLVVVSNQAGVAHGYYGQAAVEELHQHMRKVLLDQGIYLDAIYYCPHHPQGKIDTYTISCDCRKPAPGMLLQASRDLSLDLEACVLVGDKCSDLEAARSAGLSQAILVESGHTPDDISREQANMVVSDLFEAALAITT